MSTLVRTQIDRSKTSTFEQRADPKLLVVSFSYPPKQEPRAIQVSRLLKHLNACTVLVCEGNGAEDTQSIGLGDMEGFLHRTLRVPLTTSPGRHLMNRFSRRVYLPAWSRTPDHLGPWKKPVLETIDRFMTTQKYRPDVLVTFAFPLIDNIIGLELKRRFNLPWLAHFSDPWVDSPFRTDDRLTKALNTRLEQNVVERADLLVFTSRETADLVMQKYDPAFRSKVKIVAHAYEPHLFQSVPNNNSDRLIIRYLGDLYLSRTPKPLFQALQILSSREPELVNRFRFEIIGDIHELNLQQMGLAQVPKGLIEIRPRVSYRESLSLMMSAAGLMVIDFPVPENAQSVFLPSKLIEYVGADRPIIGLTPRGTAADLIGKLGGWVADPGSAEQVAGVMRQFLVYLWGRRQNPQTGWGPPELRDQFEAKVVAKQFQDVLMELVK